MKNKILQGDIIELVRTLAAKSVNTIITSTPYFGLRDYDLPPTNWPEVSYAPMAGLPEVTIPAMTCCFGLEDNIEAYVGHMVLVFRGLWRVLRDDGVAWLNLGDSYTSSSKDQCNPSGNTGQATLNNGLTRPPIIKGLPPKNLCGIPWRCALALQADGWYLRSDIIWAKKNCMPESVTDRPTKAHEYLFLLAKSERYYYDADAIREPHKPESIKRDQAGYKAAFVGRHTMPGEDRPHSDNHNGFNNPAGRNKRTVWHLSSQSYKGAHFAVMPEALVEPCLLAGCPAQVCVECGEPWVRVVEKETVEHPSRRGSGPIRQLASADAGQGQVNLEKSNLGMNNKTKTLAFTPTCKCSAPSRPGIVLDPFFGSGTVGRVAKKHKRDWLGIELNPTYIELARKRLDQTQPPLFAT